MLYGDIKAHSEALDKVKEHIGTTYTVEIFCAGRRCMLMLILQREVVGNLMEKLKVKVEVSYSL